jgi:hypothetical protein
MQGRIRLWKTYTASIPLGTSLRNLIDWRLPAKKSSSVVYFRIWLKLIHMRIDKSSEAIRLNDDLITTGQSIDVVQGEWRIGTGKLSTIGVASCLALAAHNEATRKGLLGHFSTISPEAQSNPKLACEQFNDITFDEALAHLPELGPVRETYIWLGGAALQSDRSLTVNSSIMSDRRYGRTKLAETAARFGFKDTAINLGWSPPDSEVYIRLDCEAGRLLVRPIDEYS